MAWSRDTWLDLIVVGLIAIVLIIVVSEEVLGIFLKKPTGGILTIITVGILGYMYFSK